MNIKEVTYSYYEPGLVPEPSEFRDTNPALKNVEAAFASLPESGAALAAWDGEQIATFRYTQDALNKMGLQNHFQGMQRLNQAPYLVLSGGDINEPMSHVFIVRMASRSADGSWGSNVTSQGRPPAEDRAVATLGLDPYLWHAGGLSLLGDILAVPIESSTTRTSKIVFYSLREPEAPRLFSYRIDRPHGKTGAVALTKLPNGYYLAAVWSDSDALPRRLEFYLSRSTNFFDGFDENFVRWLPEEVQAASGQQADFSNFQNINFLTQTDGTLYLAGTHNTARAAPVEAGEDRADLYRVDFPEATLAPEPVLQKPILTKVAGRRFFSERNQSNLDAAGGLYVDASGTLALYAGFHFRDQGVMRFTEYWGATRS